MTNTNDHEALFGQVADQLRTIRLQAGLASKDLAAKVGWAPSKVSRIENGHQQPTPADIAAWLHAAGAPADRTPAIIALLEEARLSQRQWKRRMQRGQAPVQANYNELVQRSTLIRHFETVYVPGLLQTPDYARRVLTEMVTLHHLDVADVEAAVAVRIQRQSFLYDMSKRFEFLLAEPVVRWLLCPPDVMRAQIDRLQTVVGLPNVRFGILPLGVELSTTPQNSFQLYDDLACVETFIGETRHTGDEAAAYAAAMDRMWTEAREGDAARALLVRAAHDLPA
ncbi:MAG: helix-turn-helix transcriptional regulator [Dactylosporangium sp.]|nr:helix-turn-helix transcriptional regulator [Dactylosporangium sp.]